MKFLRFGKDPVKPAVLAGKGKLHPLFALATPTQDTIMKCDLTKIQSAITRAVSLINGQYATIADLKKQIEVLEANVLALENKATADQGVIDELTATLEAAIPDMGGSMGGIV